MASLLSYKSYQEYVDAVIATSQTRYTDIYLRKLSRRKVRVVDISSAGCLDVSELEAPVENCGGREYHDFLEAERRALRTEVKGLKTRLVLFSVASAGYGLVHDLYGLEFQIEPSFFAACNAEGRGCDYRSSLFPEEDSPKFLNLGRGWCAKFVQRESDHSPPQRGATIILISLPWDNDVRGVHASMLAQATGMDPKFLGVGGTALRMAFPMGFKKAKLSELLQPTSMHLTDLYIILLSTWRISDFIDANEHPMKLLLSVLELHVNRCQAMAAYHYHVFLEERREASASGFETLWRPLRDTMVSAALPFEAFKQYDSLHAGGAVQQVSKLQQLLERFDHTCKRVSQFEQHVRDELQLLVGHLSLLESKESIKQSKIAIEESKRLKMLTILAFVFIPISLATSVFGMNVQELNSSGQPIWIFVVTAITLLAVALWIWAIFYHWTKYIHAPRLSEPYIGDRDSSLDETVGTYRWKRIGLLIWLISHGHLLWCWRSGIVFSLLTSGRIGFTVTCKGSGIEDECKCVDKLNPHQAGLMDLKQDIQLADVETHSAHAPCAYIFAHAHAQSASKTAFSFARYR